MVSEQPDPRQVGKSFDMKEIQDMMEKIVIELSSLKARQERTEQWQTHCDQTLKDLKETFSSKDQGNDAANVNLEPPDTKALVKYEETEYECNSCSIDCSSRRYHSLKHNDFHLCLQCFDHGNFDDLVTSVSDFILIESAETLEEMSLNILFMESDCDKCCLDAWEDMYLTALFIVDDIVNDAHKVFDEMPKTEMLEDLLLDILFTEDEGVDIFLSSEDMNSNENGALGTSRKGLETRTLDLLDPSLKSSSDFKNLGDPEKAGITYYLFDRLTVHNGVYRSSAIAGSVLHFPFDPGSNVFLTTCSYSVVDVVYYEDKEVVEKIPHQIVVSWEVMNSSYMRALWFHDDGSAFFDNLHVLLKLACDVVALSDQFSMWDLSEIEVLFSDEIRQLVNTTTFNL